MAKATKSDWKTVAGLAIQESLGYEQTFSQSDFERLCQGIIPEQMEDKWFVYYEDGWLYLHRSWTGHLVYRLRFEKTRDGVRVAESFVNQDPAPFGKPDLTYDQLLLDFLLRGLMLGQDVAFPIPSHVAGTKGIFQHHIAGRAYPEKVIPEKRVPPHAADVIIGGSFVHPNLKRKPTLWQRLFGAK